MIKFNKNDYRASKIDVINKIKETHDWQKTEGFIADGIICPEIYEIQKLKILCILGESYGYDECKMVDIEDQLKDNIIGVGDPKRQTSTKIPALLWLILKSHALGRKISWADFPKLLISNKSNLNELQDTISKIAWVNVKKASRHITNWGNDATRQNENDIYNNAIRNRDILKIQIDSIAPDLMIVCSNPVFNGLYDSDLLGNGIERNKKYQLQTNILGQKVIQVNHPSYYRDWGYEGIYKLYEIIYGGIRV